MIALLLGAFGLLLGLAVSEVQANGGCLADAVQVGPVCVDKFKASVWSVSDPTKVAALKALAQGGKATLAELTVLGATQHGVPADDYPCSHNGNDCKDKIFAFSIPGVTPSARITWFQAQQAAANSGKRLLSNAEWQMAAAGTPDPGASPGSQDCNIKSSGPDLTGAHAKCVSSWGVFDMVGNLWEWVADWVPLSTTCTTPLFAGDFNCLAGASTTSGPGALLRGGDWRIGTVAGVFAVRGNVLPSHGTDVIGFRAAR